MRLKPRGIVLISVMFLAALIAMYVVSSAILSKGQYGAMRQTAEDRRAEEAARSGLEYAQARLEENPEWRGDGNGVIVDTPSLMVREELGNVVGLLTTSDGGRAQFRIRFNHQDGANGGDALPDPTAPMRIDSSHVSVNNVLNRNQNILPIADGTNFSCQGTVAGYPVPAFSAAVICEGRAFEDLARADLQDLNPRASRVQSTRVIEAFYRISDFTGDAPAEDAVGMAGGNVDLQLFSHRGANKQVSMTNFQGSGPAQFRGRGDISITDGEKNAALIAGKDANLLMLSDAALTAVLGSGVQRGSEDVNGDFYRLAWDQAGQTSAEASLLPAGVYVFWNSDQRLHYYGMNFEQFVKHIKANPTDPGASASMPEGMTFVKSGEVGPDGVTSNKHRFVITEDIKVQGSDTVTDLTIIPRAGAKEDLGPEPVGPGEVSPEEMYDATNDLAGDTNVGGRLHTLLRTVADGANINISGGTFEFQVGRADVYEERISSGGSVSWDHGNLSLNNDQTLVITSLLRGGILLEGVSNPNLELLEPVSGQTYRLKPLALLGALGAGGSAGSGMTELTDSLEAAGVPASTEPLTPTDFEITLAPKSEEGVRVVAPGDVRIAADVKGSGASISAQGDIRLVGMGFNLDAANGEAGTDVSLYSTKNIFISTLRKKGVDNYEFAGLDLRGVLYSWGNIDLRMSHEDETSNSAAQKVHIQGTMVAYGGEPGKDRPGTAGGDITIKADQIDLVFDPGYLLGVSGANGYKVTLSPLSQSYRQ